MRGFVNAGPQIGLLLGDSYKSNFDIYNLPEFSQKSKVKEIYTMDIAHRFDYGITAGAGIEFRIKTTWYRLEGRFAMDWEIYSKQEERCIRGFPQPNNNGITGIFISLLISALF